MTSPAKKGVRGSRGWIHAKRLSLTRAAVYSVISCRPLSGGAGSRAPHTELFWESLECVYIVPHLTSHCKSLWAIYQAAAFEIMKR